MSGCGELFIPKKEFEFVFNILSTPPSARTNLEKEIIRTLCQQIEKRNKETDSNITLGSLILQRLT